MKYDNFYDFLREQHGNGYMGLDDDMGDACDNWIGDLDPEELVDFADLYAYQVTEQLKKQHNII